MQRLERTARRGSAALSTDSRCRGLWCIPARLRGRGSRYGLESSRQKGGAPILYYRQTVILCMCKQVYELLA